MTAAKTTPPPPAPQARAPESLTSILRAAEAVHTDRPGEPGDIAADDVGATRLATALERAQHGKSDPKPA
jgi:hypothetical protein